MVEGEQAQSDGNASFLRAARAGNLEKITDCLKGNVDINTSNANGLNALHLAAKEGHVHVVTELLKKGANVNSATKKGNTALHIASLAGQEEVVRVLVNLGANINVQSQNGFTPLYMAAQENHDVVVSFLLANGANQGLATEDGFTPLAVALQQGHDRVVAVLLENDTKGRVRLPALHIAAKKDDCKAASLLLQSDHNPDITSKSGFTPLHIAAHYGNENIAHILLSKGADVNYSAKHQITPIHVASKWGKKNMVALLLEKGANIESSTRDGLTPLHCAARSGHDQVVNLLLEKGAPFLAKTKNGLAPLHMASQGDHVDSARNLLHHKVPVDDVTVDYLTALHVAAHCGHVKVAKLLLDRKADPNARALNGFTPLHIACKKNRIKVVELLLKHGASIEATTESGLTPLHVASFMGCMNIVIYLIQNGANPDVPTVRGETPLHLAARANQTDIIRILLRNGASVDARAREEQTPLHIAARLGNADIVSLLLQHGAAVDSTTKDLYTALHIASKEDQEEVTSYLLDHGASLTATTKKGFTPLHLAAKYGNIKVARLLIQKSAPIDAQGKNGVTPLHVAAHYDHVNIALLLLDKGASPHAVAKNGYTPLHIAAKKNQIDIASSLLEYRAKVNAESKAGFIPLHLSAQGGHADMSSLLIEHKSGVNHKANNGLTPLHLCAQEDRVNVASTLVRSGAEVCPQTKAGYTPLHVASHFGQMGMVRFLLQQGANVHTTTTHGYTSLHQAAQQGHSPVVNLLLENQASPNATTTQGQTPLSIAQRLGYISVVETLKVVTETTVTTTTTTITEEKYKVVAPETMQEAFMTDSEDEGGADFDEASFFGKPAYATHIYLPFVNGARLPMSEEAMLGDQSYRYLTADEMKSLGDDSLPIDVTKDEKHDALHSMRQFGAPMVEEDTLSPQHVIPVESGFSEKFSPDNVELTRAPVHAGSFSWEDDFYYSYPPKAMLRSSRLKWKTFLVSFMVDARGGAMRGCRHSGVRVIIPPRKASMPMRITCRYLRKEKLVHPPPLMEGEACASRILEMGPVGAKFLGPVIIEVPHFASSRGKEREITILRSDCGENWKEHTLEASEEAVQDVLNESFEGEELSALEDLNTNRISRILTTDFPQYFAIISRVRQEVHGVGPEGGMLSSTVVPQVQAIFPEGALTKKIRVGLQAQPIAPELVAKLLGNRVAVSPIVTVEPRRRKFHKPITLTIPVPQAATKGMINQYSGDAPTLRLLCSITGSTKSGGSSKAQWEDVTGSTPLTFVNDCVSFTTTVSARFWLMDCRQLSEVSRYATELYQEAVYVPFMSKFVIFAKRHDPYEAQLRVFCMTDDKEDKTLETQEHFIEVAKSRDVEVLEGKMQYLEFAGNLVPVTNSGDQLKLSFQAFHENRLPFTIRVKDPHMEPMGRIAFMRESKVGRGEPPQVPICNLNVALPDALFSESSSDVLELVTFQKKYDFMQEAGLSKPELIHRADLRLSDIARELDKDWMVLARQLEVSESDIERIRTETSAEHPIQAIAMLRLWLQKAGPKATGNELEKGLRKINREDIIKTCMFNVELVTDDVEKAVAKVHLDQSGFDVFKEELGSSREASMRRGASLDVSYDEQDIMKEAESAAETSSETGSLFERDQIYQALPDDKVDGIPTGGKTALIDDLTLKLVSQNDSDKIGLENSVNGTKGLDAIDHSNFEEIDINVSYSGSQEHSFWPPGKLNESVTINHKSSQEDKQTKPTNLNENSSVNLAESHFAIEQLDACTQSQDRDDKQNGKENGLVVTNDLLEREMYLGLVEDNTALSDDVMSSDVCMEEGSKPSMDLNYSIDGDSTVSKNANGVHVHEMIGPLQNNNSANHFVSPDFQVFSGNLSQHASEISEVGSPEQVIMSPDHSGVSPTNETITVISAQSTDQCLKNDGMEHPNQTRLKNRMDSRIVSQISESQMASNDNGHKEILMSDSEDARIRRASKTPPPSPVDFSGKDDDTEEKFKEVSFTQLYPDTKEVIVKKYTTETRSGEISTGVGGLLPSAGHDIPARLTESETWPSGELDTSQVSLSSLPYDEKSEPTTATISGVAAAEDPADDDEEFQDLSQLKDFVSKKISPTKTKFDSKILSTKLSTSLLSTPEKILCFQELPLSPVTEVSEAEMKETCTSPYSSSQENVKPNLLISTRKGFRSRKRLSPIHDGGRIGQKLPPTRVDKGLSPIAVFTAGPTGVKKEESEYFVKTYDAPTMQEPEQIFITTSPENPSNASKLHPELLKSELVEKEADIRKRSKVTMLSDVKFSNINISDDSCHSSSDTASSPIVMKDEVESYLPCSQDVHEESSSSSFERVEKSTSPLSDYMLDTGIGTDSPVTADTASSPFNPDLQSPSSLSYQSNLLHMSKENSSTQTIHVEMMSAHTSPIDGPFSLQDSNLSCCPTEGSLKSDSLDDVSKTLGTPCSDNVDLIQDLDWSCVHQQRVPDLNTSSVRQFLEDHSDRGGTASLVSDPAEADSKTGPNELHEIKSSSDHAGIEASTSSLTNVEMEKLLVIESFRTVFSTEAPFSVVRTCSKEDHLSSLGSEAQTYKKDNVGEGDCDNQTKKYSPEEHISEDKVHEVEEQIMCYSKETIFKSSDNIDVICMQDILEPVCDISSIKKSEPTDFSMECDVEVVEESIVAKKVSLSLDDVNETFVRSSEKCMEISSGTTIAKTNILSAEKAEDSSKEGIVTPEFIRRVEDEVRSSSPLQNYPSSDTDGIHMQTILEYRPKKEMGDKKPESENLTMHTKLVEEIRIIPKKASLSFDEVNEPYKHADLPDFSTTEYQDRSRDENVHYSSGGNSEKDTFSNAVDEIFSSAEIVESFTSVRASQDSVDPKATVVSDVADCSIELTNRIKFEQNICTETGMEEFDDHGEIGHIIQKQVIQEKIGTVEKEGDYGTAESITPFLASEDRTESPESPELSFAEKREFFQKLSLTSSSPTATPSATLRITAGLDSQTETLEDVDEGNGLTPEEQLSFAERLKFFQKTAESTEEAREPAEVKEVSKEIWTVAEANKEGVMGVSSSVRKDLPVRVEDGVTESDEAYNVTEEVSLPLYECKEVLETFQDSGRKTKVEVVVKKLVPGSEMFEIENISTVHTTSIAEEPKSEISLVKEVKKELESSQRMKLQDTRQISQEDESEDPIFKKCSKKVDTITSIKDIPSRDTSTTVPKTCSSLSKATTDAFKKDVVENKWQRESPDCMSSVKETMEPSLGKSEIFICTEETLDSVKRIMSVADAESNIVSASVSETTDLVDQTGDFIESVVDEESDMASFEDELKLQSSQKYLAQYDEKDSGAGKQLPKTNVDGAISDASAIKQAQDDGETLKLNAKETTALAVSIEAVIEEQSLITEKLIEKSRITPRIDATIEPSQTPVERKFTEGTVSESSEYLKGLTTDQGGLDRELANKPDIMTVVTKVTTVKGYKESESVDEINVPSGSNDFKDDNDSLIEKIPAKEITVKTIKTTTLIKNREDSSVHNIPADKSNFEITTKTVETPFFQASDLARESPTTVTKIIISTIKTTTLKGDQDEMSKTLQGEQLERELPISKIETTKLKDQEEKLKSEGPSEEGENDASRSIESNEGKSESCFSSLKDRSVEIEFVPVLEVSDDISKVSVDMTGHEALGTPCSFHKDTSFESRHDVQKSLSASEHEPVCEKQSKDDDVSVHGVVEKAEYEDVEKDLRGKFKDIVQKDKTPSEGDRIETLECVEVTQFKEFSTEVYNVPSEKLLEKFSSKKIRIESNGGSREPKVTHKLNQFLDSVTQQSNEESGILSLPSELVVVTKRTEEWIDQSGEILLKDGGIKEYTMGSSDGILHEDHLNTTLEDDHHKRSSPTAESFDDKARVEQCDTDVMMQLLDFVSRNDIELAEVRTEDEAPDIEEDVSPSAEEETRIVLEEKTEGPKDAIAATERMPESCLKADANREHLIPSPLRSSFESVTSPSRKDAPSENIETVVETKRSLLQEISKVEKAGQDSVEIEQDKQTLSDVKEESYGKHSKSIVAERSGAKSIEKTSKAIEFEIPDDPQKEIGSHLPSQSVEIEDVSDVIAHHEPSSESELVDSFEKHAPVESNGQKRIPLDDSKVQTNTSFTLKTGDSEPLNDQGQDFMSLAFVNTAFAGAEIIDEVESVSMRSRSPYEVIRDDVTAELGDRAAPQRSATESIGMHFISEVEEDMERSQEKNKFEVKRRPILQHIPSEISEEDLVEREIDSPITKEFEAEDLNAQSLNVQSKMSAVVGSVSESISTSYDQVQKSGIVDSGSIESGKMIATSHEKVLTTDSIAGQKTEPRDASDDQSISFNNNNLESSSHEVISCEAIATVQQIEKKGTKDSLPSKIITKTVVNEQSSTEVATSSKSDTSMAKPGSSTSNGSHLEFKHRRQVSSLSGQPSAIKGLNFKGMDSSSILLHQTNGPGEVDYRTEYDDEHYARREVPLEKQLSDMQVFAGVSDQEYDESIEVSRLYSVSDDAVDAEIGNILSLEDQSEDVIERPVTPEPPTDETLYEPSDIKEDVFEMAKRKVTQIEHTFPLRVSHHEFEIADDFELEIVVDRPYEASREACASSIPVRESEQSFAYGMKFEKGIMDEGEEAMDVDSDQFSEEKESAYAYGMRFERDQELDSEEAPCYGDLYTHEEEDEEGFENIEKIKGSPKPDYDILAGRKYFSKNEFDNASVSSLQEFEHLEEDIVSGRKSSIGSIDSLNGRAGNSKSGEHDDVSMSSLTEFERLERECLESEKIDPAMQESITQLSEIEEGHESQASEDNRSEEKEDDVSIAEDYDGHLDKIDEIILHAQSKVEDSEDKLPFQYLIAHAQKDVSQNKMVQDHFKSKSEVGIAQRKFEEDDIEQDSLHEDISVKPDSLTDDKHEFQDSLHEDKYEDLDSLQGDMPEEMRDSLLEERIIEEDSLHDMDILPDESSLSLESSLAAVDSSREDHVRISINQTAEYDIDLDSLKGLKLGGSFTAQITEKGAGDMISSTDSLEQSCSGGQPAFHVESESVMTSSLNSAFTSEDCTMVSSTDTLEHEGRITYRFEDIPVDEIEDIVQSQKVFVDSEGNIQTRVDVQRVMEGNINGNTLTSHSRTEVILPSPTSVRSTVTYTDAQYSGPDGSGYFRDGFESGRDSSHFDPDVEVEEIHTTDEHGNPKTTRKIKRVIRTQKFSSSSSPKDVEEKMKEFLREHAAGEDSGKGLEEVSEERRVDEKGNVVLVRTVQQQMLTQPQVHSRSFRGPEAEHLSQEFVESFQTLDPTENLYEYEKVDDDGNVVRVTEQVVVRPEVHTITFSGSDAHRQMEDYMQQWQKTQSAGEFEATKPSYAKEGYYQQLVSSSTNQDFIVPTAEGSPQKTSSEVIQTGSSTVTTTKILPSGLKDISSEKSVMYTTASISEHQQTEPKQSQDKMKE